MLPEIGASELIVIAIVALIVVGPKDLPVLMRKVGSFMNRLRGMAAEFRASFDDMARQSELDDLRKEVEALRRGQLDEMRSLKTDADDLVYDIDRSIRDEPPPVVAPYVDEPGEVASPDAADDVVVPDPVPPQAAEPAPAPRARRTRKAAS